MWKNLVLSLLIGNSFTPCAIAKAKKIEPKKTLGTLNVTSSVLKAGTKINDNQVYNDFGCTGKNISPDLKWTGAPKDTTKAFAVTVYDPDAPTGSGWWHWMVYNIPASVDGLKLGEDFKTMPNVVQGRTDFGTSGYGGPCPPKGSKPHRYIFKVFALKDRIPLKSEDSAAKVGFYINQLKLAEGSLEAIYSR